MKEKLLIKTANELQEVLGLDPELDVTLDPAELMAQVKEAATFLKMDDGITDEIIQALRELFPDSSELDGEVVEVFEALGILDEQEPGGEQEPELDEEEPGGEQGPEDDDDLFGEVDGAETMKELKDIAKSNDEFKEIRGQLSRYKSADELRTAMLDMLEVAPEKIEPEPAYVKKEENKIQSVVKKEKIKSEIKKSVDKKEKEKQSAKSEKTRAQIFAEIFNENIPRTMNELVDEMMKRYHSDSLTGAKTFVSIYVSILKEVDLIERNEKDQYIKNI